MLNPLPVQNFADDITIVTHDARSLHEMIKVSEPIKKRADLMWNHQDVLFYTEEDRGTIGIPAKWLKAKYCCPKLKHQGIEKKWIIRVFG